MKDKQKATWIVIIISFLLGSTLYGVYRNAYLNDQVNLLQTQLNVCKDGIGKATK